MAYPTSSSYTATMPPVDPIAEHLPQSFSSPASSMLNPLALPTRRPANGASATGYISKTYKQASTLFLTRRLPESLTTLAPLISPPRTAAAGKLDGLHGNGAGAGGGGEEPPPVAVATRSTRIKVWSLYLTILNAVVEMESDEGKDAFGAQEWRALCKKVRDGEAWEEVVRFGYHGVEGDVDSDVVINLATLLLAHSQTQLLTQKRLETWLASSASPSLDLSSALSSPSTPTQETYRHYHHHHHHHSRRASSRSRPTSASGANTPRDLNARVKILELYTLHVLPRNDEWEYAREFIGMSALLDEERREAFLLALGSLREQKDEEEEMLEREEREREERERWRAREEEERREERRRERERERREDEETERRLRDEREREKEVLARRASGRTAMGRSDGGARKSPKSLGARAGTFVGNVRILVEEIGRSLRTNPMVLTRLLVFIIGIIVVFGQRGVRERMQRMLATSWQKVRATVGMGVKVTYI